jgi:transcriptional regulator with XRE-family HTH domain
MNANNLIGSRLRQTRKDLELSLADLAKRSGVSIGTLSQLERGLGSPSLRTIERIGQALGVPIYWLLDAQGRGDEAADSVVVRSGQGIALTVTEEGMEKTLITPRSFEPMQLMTVKMEPGSKSSPGYFRHDGIDVGHVLSGSLHIEVDGRLYVLSSGDTFAFDSHLPHRFENRGGSRAEVLWINTKSKLSGLPEPDSQ